MSPQSSYNSQFSAGNPHAYSRPTDPSLLPIWSQEYNLAMADELARAEAVGIYNQTDASIDKMWEVVNGLSKRHTNNRSTRMCICRLEFFTNEFKAFARSFAPQANKPGTALNEEAYSLCEEARDIESELKKLPAVAARLGPSSRSSNQGFY